MNINFKITDTLLKEIMQDLARPHAFAFERVGFLTCRVGKIADDGWVMLGSIYYPVEDNHYVPNDGVGAEINSDAIRKMLEIAYNESVSIVHIHKHAHRGTPELGRVDKREMAQLIPNFWNVRPKLPHAAIVVSEDSMCGFAWEPASKQRFSIGDFTVVGAPLKFIREQQYE